MSDDSFFPFDPIGDDLFDFDGDGKTDPFEMTLGMELFIDRPTDDADDDPDFGIDAYDGSAEDDGGDEADCDEDDCDEDDYDPKLDARFDEPFDFSPSIGRRRAQARRWASQLEKLAEQLADYSTDTDIDAIDADGDRWEQLDWLSDHLQQAETAVREAAELLSEAADGWY